MDLDVLSSSADVFAGKQMTPEAAFLLTSLRQSPVPAPAPLNWEILLMLAETHGVLPLFYRAHAGRLPGNFVPRFRSQWALSLFLTHELDELLGEFRKHRIEVLPLKGPVMAKLLYGDVSLRPCDDLDLLVRPEEFLRAEALLQQLGFTPIGEADDYHRDFGRNGTFVELHFGIASPSALRFDLAGAWKRARMVEFSGYTVPFFSPADLLLYLSLHGLKHRFARLMWVLDVVRVLETLSEPDAAGLLHYASALQLKNLLLTSCEIARSSFDVKLPSDIAAEIQARPGLAEHAAAIACGILATAADPTTSVHDASYYLRLADNPSHRWHQRLQFFLPTQQDFQCAARYHIHPKCAAVLRPFRLLFKYGPVPALRTLFPQCIKMPGTRNRVRMR